jgi:translation initiation factor 4E
MSDSSSPSDSRPSSGDHPLETSWSFWWDSKLQRNADQSSSAAYKSYEQSLHKIGTFSTVEGFYRHYAFIQRPDDLPKDHNLFLFRHTTTPAWESFPSGGCWIVKVRKHNGVINRLWEELVFACIGEWLEDPEIVGVCLSTRARDDNISVWHKGTNGDAARLMIGEKLKEILNLDESTQVEHKFFKSAIADGSTHRNAKPYVYAAQAVGVPVHMPMMGQNYQQQFQQ